MPAHRRLTVVHVVPAFHYDVAYCKTFRGYLPESLRIIRKALQLLGRNADYTFCIEQTILAREYWNRFPRDRQRMRKLAQAGRLHFAPGMFTMPDGNIPSGESFIRNALIGRDWLQRQLGVSPNCCWMPDIFGHNPQSPQLARTCGFGSYMFERGKRGSWDTTFLWKGLDGTTIPAHWEVDTYYGINLALAHLKERPAEWIRKQLRTEVLDLLKAHSPEPGVLISPEGGDFCPPDQKHIDWVKAWNREGNGVRFQYSTPGAYFEEIRRRRVALKTLSDDLNPLLEGCWSSRIRIKQYNRRLEETAASLELLEVLAGGGHRMSDRLWEAVAWNAFHDIICGTLEKTAAREALAKYAAAEKTADRAIRARMLRLVRQSFSGGRKPGLLVFNSLPYPRRELVAFPGRGNAFAMADLPASGFAVVRSSAGGRCSDRVHVRAGGTVIENRFLRVEFSGNGTIGSLYDKRRKKELAPSGGGLNNPLLQSDSGDLWMVGTAPVNGTLLRTVPLHQPAPLSAMGYHREGAVGKAATDADCGPAPRPRIVSGHPLQGAVEFEYPSLRFTTQISLRADEAIVRFRSTFLPKGKKYRLRVAFPTAIRDGRIRHSVPFGHITRPEGEYAVQGWMDYADSGKGLLLLNRGLPGNNVTDGVMMLSLFRGVSMESKERVSWYEEGIGQVFEYGLMPFDPRDAGYNPAREAALFNRPVVAIEAALPDGLPGRGAGPFVELQGDNAELSCVRMQGQSLVVRLWESRGRSGKAALVFKDAFASCIRTDATGSKIRDEQLSGHRVELGLQPFEIVTLQLGCNPGNRR